ncbi:MAG: pyridoxine 5'-phosphate synthase [Candidatus Delongbacteria bacterium]|nr:pyridoxine 5'-phosphate synthase [Candidatus Delongbacteria bacterium]MCG2760332.1 pyridoxine 5'-phosphate synthase [Candidatus Delongbacteria bacterium]
MRLGVNIDHIATIREARKTYEPDPVAATIICDLAGADGIVCHLREDRRHINDDDLKRIRETVKSHLNLEMAGSDEMVRIATKIKPEMVTLVPEKREELTTEGGLDVSTFKDHLRDIVFRLRSAGIKVSIFIDPDISQIKQCSNIEADLIEIHTGRYANAKTEHDIIEEFEKIKQAAIYAHKLGLGVSAGHGLNYHNVKDFVEIEEIEELNIGHSIISRAVLVGLDRAVREMIDLIK